MTGSRRIVFAHYDEEVTARVGSTGGKPLSSINHILAELKEKAKAEGLWNLFLPHYGELGAGLSNLQYAPLAEIMGRVEWAPEVFNCNAPDSGNIETLCMYADEDQKQRWLLPLANGETRSAFVMTEPEVASSDATNICTLIERDGDEYVINGRKWFASGASHPRCDFFIVMGKNDPSAPRHLQQSQILVPKNAPGITIVRNLPVFNEYDAPFGHAEILFENVRVPASNMLLGEGRGFEIAQGRLGPGRVHHAMRLIGQAQRALELMCQRAEKRTAFGKPLSKQQSVREWIGESAYELEQARLLTLKCADKMDREGNQNTRDLIAMIKVAVPRMAAKVIDRAMQVHGACGFTNDTFLVSSYRYARTCQVLDGPDQVHLMTLGKQTLAKYV